MIVYAVVSRQSDAAILCEYSTDNLSGNAPQCTAALLEHLRDRPKILKKGDLKTLRHSNKASSGGMPRNSQTATLQPECYALPTYLHPIADLDFA